MADPFEGFSRAPIDPATRHETITPSDTVDLPNRPRALYCLTGGNVAVRDEAEEEIIYPVTAGQMLMIRAVRVMATGTTAEVVAWW